MQSRWVAVLAMSWVCVACNGEDGVEEEQPPVMRGPAATKLDGFKKGSLTTADSATEWALQASAPLMYVRISTASSFGSVDAEGKEADANCPVVKREGLGTSRTGGCTDAKGTQWFGSMTESISATGITYTYSDFGYERTVSCGDKSARGKLLYQGSLTLSSSGETQGFGAELVQTAHTVSSTTCAEEDVVFVTEYKGTVTGASSKDQTKPSTWNGSGRLGSPELGTISAETRNEVIHSQTCQYEALSGVTTLASDGHQVEIRYDGATDCSDQATVQWSLDGAAKGKLEGIACAAANGPSLALWGVGVFGALGLLRRRARS